MADPTFPTMPDANAVYAPLEQNLKDQAAANANRYAQNQADVSSITGVLTSIAPLDRDRVNKQFADSIQQQSENLASRTAEARKNQAAGAAGAQTAAGELGSGGMPAPTDSWSNQAVNQGIAQSNASQTGWENFMNAMKLQQTGNIDARQSGISYQVANALQQLSRNRQNELQQQNAAWNQLQSQKAQGAIQAGISQAEMAQESDIANAKNQTAMNVALARAQGSKDVANIAAGASRYATDTRAALAANKAATSGKKYTNDVAGWKNKLVDSNVSSNEINSLMGQASKAYTSAVKKYGKDQRGNTVKVTPGQIYSEWVAMYGNKKNGLSRFATPMQDYINDYLPR